MTKSTDGESALVAAPSGSAAPSALAGLRTTRQRVAVLRALEASDDFRSAQEWHEIIKEGGDAVGLTTVYRTMSALATSGTIDAIVDEDGEVRYRRCSGGHHHHLVCRTCGATVELEAPEIEVWAHRTADDHGFSDISHTVEIFGRCPACRDNS